MESAPHIPSGEHEPDDDKEDGKKKKKPPFRAPPPISDTAGVETEKPYIPKGIGDAIFEGFGKKAQSERPAKAEEGKEESPSETASAESTAQDLPPTAGEGAGPSAPIEGAPDVDLHNEDDPIAAETEDDDVYEALPSQELPLDGVGGGEFVLHLNGPVAERVVPLQGEPGPGVEAGETAVPEISDETETTPADDEPEALAASATPNATEAYQNPWFTPTQSAESTPPPPQAPTPPPAAPAPTPSPVPSPMWAGGAPLSPFNQANYPNATPYVNPGEQAATKQEVADAVHRAKAAGVGQGLATGLLAGGAYEHFKHKRREKKREKQIAVHEKQLAEARKAYAIELETHETERLQQARQTAGMQERIQGLENRERAQVAAAEKPTIIPDAVAVPEQLVVPANHRIETSAWHAIEVDAKTGKAVENPAFQYGKEYYYERAQETAPVTPHASAAGEIALVAAAAQPVVSGQGSVADSPVIPNASQRTPLPLGGSNSQALAGQGTKPAQSGTNQAVSGGPLWVWLVVLGVLIVCIIAAL